LEGSVVLDGTPVADAALAAFDLVTGKALPLVTWPDGAAVTPRTDTNGAFELALAPPGGDRLVRLVAVSDARCFTAVFDARGRTIGTAPAPNAAYRLGQTGAFTVRLRLTPASTAATKAFEGALKLSFRRADDGREAVLAATFTAAEQAVRDVELALARRPELAEPLLRSIGKDGLVEDLDAFRATIANLGVFDALFEAVKARLIAVTAMPLTADERQAPLRHQDFPLDRVTIQGDGTFRFSGGPAVRLSGVSGQAFIPTPVRRRRRSAPGDGVRSYAFVPDFTGSIISELAVLSANELLVGCAPRLYRYDLRTEVATVAQGSDDTANTFFAQNEFIAAAPTRRPGLDSVLVSFFVNDQLSIFQPLTNTLEFLLPGRHAAVGAGLTHYYACQMQDGAAVRWFEQADPQSSGTLLLEDGSEWRLDSARSMVVHDDDFSPPTVLAVHHPAGHNGAVIVAAQDGGASRTLLDLGPEEVSAIAIASPTLYLVRRYRTEVLTLDVDTLQTAVFASTTAQAKHQIADLEDLRAITLDDPSTPRYLFLGSGGETSTKKIWRLPLH
jgi:hypothetical protein